MTTHTLAARHRPLLVDTPARKPLYLATRDPLRIGAQADSLVVHQATKSVRRFPLARIDRILCGSQADWSGEALALCMASGVTITWISGRGDVLGQCAPHQGDSASRTAQLERFLEHPDWAARYSNWLRGRRMTVLADWASARTREGNGPGETQWMQRKRDYVYKGMLAEVFDADARGWCHAWTVARLCEAGLAVRYWGYDASPLELADDIAGLLWAEVNLAAGALAHGAGGGREGLLFFENWTRLNPGRAADHLAQLNRFVARENDTWR